MSEAHLFAVGVLLAWLAGVRAYMTRYPFNCFEQRLSRIVVLMRGG